MSQAYPYTISNNKIEPFLAQIRTAERPERFTQQLLRNMGFTASNDRAMPRILKELGFLEENGAPTEEYDRLRDKTDWQYVLGERIKDLYSDLYTLNTDIHNESDEYIKGAISRITGKDSGLVSRYFATFKALAALAKFELKATQTPRKETTIIEPPVASLPTKVKPAIVEQVHRDTSFHYNIQIHLPATTDISVYNAIFKSLKDSLLV